jgi:hypothetical protein
VTHEENALVWLLPPSTLPSTFLALPILYSLSILTTFQFYNISISNSKTQLLLNDVTIFPLPKSVGNTEQPPAIYVPQVHSNFSISSLISTIECTHKPCHNFNGYCFCIPDLMALGSMGVDYEYRFSLRAAENAAEMTPESGEVWTLSFDALGGSNGYMDDPFATFESVEQKMLSVEVQQDEQGVLLILGANLTTRKHLSEPTLPKSFWDNVRHFFGAREEMEEGYIIYRQDEWDMYGRTGTLNNLLKEIWYGWPWSLILIIVGSVIGGLTVLYAIYRSIIFVIAAEGENGGNKWCGEVRNETWSRERGYYLEEADDAVESTGLLAGDEDIDAESDKEELFIIT